MAYGWDGDSREQAAKLLARAQGGDFAAAQQLKQAASEGGWRPGQRNAAIDAYNEFTPGTQNDFAHVKNKHGFLGDVGHAIGGGLKFLAPLAAAAIPGLGPLGGALLGAGGSALGGAMHGDKFDLMKTGMAGLAGLAGQKADLGHHIFGGGAPDAAASAPSLPSGMAPSPTAMMPETGNMTAGMGAASRMPPAMPSAPVAMPQSHDFLSQLGNAFKDEKGNTDFGKLAKLGGGVAGLAESRSMRHSQERLANSQLEMQRRGLQMQEGAYNERKPTRDLAMKKLGTLGMNSSIF